MRVFGSKFVGWCVLTVVAIIFLICAANFAARSQPVQTNAAVCRPMAQGMAILAQLADLRQAEIRSLTGEPLKRFLDFLDSNGLQLDREQTASVILMRFPDGHIEFAVGVTGDVAVCAARQFIIPASAVPAMLRAIDGTGV